MNLDIQTAVGTAFFLIAIVAVILFVTGIRTILSGQKLMFFRKRRERISRGWRAILVAIILGAIAISINQFAEPVVYKVFPPSPTITLTPTITVTPTITTTPTITLTPTITETPSITPTPEVPPAIQVQFTSVTTPSADTVFSPLSFSTQLDDNLQPVNLGTEFANPLVKLYGAFSYNNMTPGAEWTAIWYRVDGWALICYETLAWDGGTGGYGYTECAPTPDQWMAGEYEVQIFIGLTFTVSGRFTITGEPPTPAPTATLTPTLTLSPTITLSPTVTIVPTITKTLTQQPSFTPTITRTPIPTLTYPPTRTRWPTHTPTITWTPRPTWTMLPTYTPRATNTPRPTQTKTPTP